MGEGHFASKHRFIWRIAAKVKIFTGGSGKPFLELAEVFLVLFVTLGPINFMNVFAEMTKDTTAAFARQLALRASLIATIAIFLSAAVGAFLLAKWRISVGAIAITGAIMLFVVAMQSIFALYGKRASPPDETMPTLDLATSPLAFPRIVTPYGIATLIVLLTLAPESVPSILGLVAIVMAIDLLVMLFVRPILRAIGVPLSLLGVVLSVLQVALSVQFALFGIRTIKADPPLYLRQGPHGHHVRPSRRVARFTSLTVDIPCQPRHIGISAGPRNALQDYAGRPDVANPLARRRRRSHRRFERSNADGACRDLGACRA